MDLMPIEYQIKAMQEKLQTYKADPVTGKLPSKYYALFTKIKNLKIEQAKQNEDKRWNDFLAQ